MSRQSGYKVTITGFLPVDQKNLQAQIKVLNALDGGVSGDLIELLQSASFVHRLTSREIDEAGNPVPRAPRKPRAAKATGRKAA